MYVNSLDVLPLALQHHPKLHTSPALHTQPPPQNHHGLVPPPFTQELREAPHNLLPILRLRVQQINGRGPKDKACTHAHMRESAMRREVEGGGKTVQMLCQRRTKKCGAVKKKGKKLTNKRYAAVIMCRAGTGCAPRGRQSGSKFGPNRGEQVPSLLEEPNK